MHAFRCPRGVWLKIGSVHGHLIASNLPCRVVRVAVDVAVLILSSLPDKF